MNLIEVIWTPSNRQLRQFGTIWLICLPLIGWIWGAELNSILGLGVIGLFIAILGCVTPFVLKPVFVGMQIVAMPVGIVLSEAALLLIFFGVFLPLGLVFRIARRIALKKSFNSSQDSYWEAKQRTTDVAMYYRQSY